MSSMQNLFQNHVLSSSKSSSCAWSSVAPRWAQDTGHTWVCSCFATQSSSYCWLLTQWKLNNWIVLFWLWNVWREQTENKLKKWNKNQFETSTPGRDGDHDIPLSSKIFRRLQFPGVSGASAQNWNEYNGIASITSSRAGTTKQPVCTLGTAVNPTIRKTGLHKNQSGRDLRAPWSHIIRDQGW